MATKIIGEKIDHYLAPCASPTSYNRHHQDDITILGTNPKLNLHLSLASWLGVDPTNTDEILCLWVFSRRTPRFFKLNYLL